MKHLNTVYSTLAVLTLAAITVPTSAQFGGNFGTPYGRNSGASFGGYGSYGNPFANFNYGQVSPNFYYGQGVPNAILQGTGNFPYYGWSDQNTVVNPDGTLDLPPYTETYGANGNFTRTDEDSEAVPVRNRSNALPRSSDAIQVSKDRNRVSFAWQGDPDSVRRITFTLLDRAKQPLRQQVITKLPAEARLTRNSRTMYYRVTVEYINGTTNTINAPL